MREAEREQHIENINRYFREKGQVMPYQNLENYSPKELMGVVRSIDRRHRRPD